MFERLVAPAGTRESPSSWRPRVKARAWREAWEAREEGGELEVDNNLTKEEMQVTEAGMEKCVQSGEEEMMEEMKGLLRRSRWRLVGRIHPSSETRWIKFEWWKFSEGFEGERKDEERRAEWSVGN